ncbi:MAG: helicase SNF2, partial [Clostridia bacterium]|nr:helicase SNF2 [Clostridia bacterium]
MDADDEQPEISGGGDYYEGDHFQLSLFPTEEEQIQSIDEAESGFGYESLFAPSFSQDDVDNILRFGSNTDRARERIVFEFSKNKSVDEKVEFLMEMYHGGYGIGDNGKDISVWYGEEGIYLANGSAARDVRTAALIEWEDAANRIDELLSEGSFATNVELAESGSYARNLLAMSILYMFRDVTDDAYFPSLKELDLHGGFPDMQEALAKALEDNEFAERLADEFETFNEAYAEHPDLLRFHFYRPDILQTQCEELLLPRIEYPEGRVELPEIRSFITEDEIREALSHGSGFSEGKQR